MPAHPLRCRVGAAAGSLTTVLQATRAEGSEDIGVLTLVKPGDDRRRAAALIHGSCQGSLGHDYPAARGTTRSAAGHDADDLENYKFASRRSALMAIQQERVSRSALRGGTTSTVASGSKGNRMRRVRS